MKFFIVFAFFFENFKVFLIFFVTISNRDLSRDLCFEDLRKFHAGKRSKHSCVAAGRTGGGVGGAGLRRVQAGPIGHVVSPIANPSTGVQRSEPGDGSGEVAGPFEWPSGPDDGPDRCRRAGKWKWLWPTTSVPGMGRQQQAAPPNDHVFFHFDQSFVSLLWENWAMKKVQEYFYMRNSIGNENRSFTIFLQFFYNFFIRTQHRSFM